MQSNTETGRAFQEKCRVALETFIGRNLDVEVRLMTTGRLHFFDLATAERDVVAECKAFGWTATGNVPSAKISTLREAVAYLRALPDGTTRYLIIKRSERIGKSETLAEYFVRLNEESLGPVNVLELPADGGQIRGVYGLFARDTRVREPAPGVALGLQESLRSADVVAELNASRNQLLRILDWLDGSSATEESVAGRIQRLYYAGRLPRIIAALMHTVREVRNAAEHDGYLPTQHEAAAAQSASAAVKEWAKKNGWQETRAANQD